MAEASKTNASSRNVYSLTGPDFTSQSRKETFVSQNLVNCMSVRTKDDKGAAGEQEKIETTLVNAKNEIVKLDSKPSFDTFCKPQNAIKFA